MGDASPEEHPDLMEHLAAEREWYDVSTAHLDSLSSRVRSEMEARVPEHQRSGTWTRPRFYYYTQDARDRDYGVIWRESRNNFAHQDAESSAEPSSDDDFAGETPTPEVVMDINSLDAGTGYLDLGLSIVSPDEDLLAYAVDTAGDERFVLRFRDLRTGEDLPDVVDEVGYSGAWTADSSTFLYTVPDDTWRSERIRAHRLGSDPAEDRDVVVEDDRRFEVTVRLSRSEQAILVHSESRQTSEVWYVDPADPDLVPRSLGGRRDGVIYSAEHVRSTDHGGGFLLVTNDDAVEFRLVSCSAPGEPWLEVRPEEPSERLDRVDAFAGHVVASHRHAGDNTLRILAADDLAGPGHVVTSRFPGGELWLGRNTWYDATSVTVADESLTEPVVHATLSLDDGTVTDDHRDDAPGHDPAAYVTEVRSLPLRRRHPGAGDDRAAPRHPAGRHGARAAVRVRRLRVRLGAGVGGAAAVAPGPRRRLRAHPHPRRR